MDVPVTRRAMLLGAASLLAACSRSDPSVAARPRPSAVPSGRPAARPAPPVPAVPPPAGALYVPPAGEPLPNLKRVAGQVAQLLGTDPAARVRLAAATGPDVVLPPEVGDRLVDGLVTARATVEVVQYGGLQPVSPRAERGAAIVVLRQDGVDASGRAAVRRRAVDVQLEQRGGWWLVRDVVLGADLPAVGASPVGRRVLQDRRIDLPDSARSDVEAGVVSDDLLVVLEQLAGVARPAVAVLRTGHAERVLDGRGSAGPVSDHHRGRAVDIHALDGVPVPQVAPAVLRAVVDVLAAAPQVRQVGAPDGRDLDLDGRGRRFFTNLVHFDHLHVAVAAAGTAR